MTIIYGFAAAVMAFGAYNELTDFDGTKFGAFCAGLASLGFVMLATL